MSLIVGVDVGGTFTDVEVSETGRPTRTWKTPSTPEDPSVGFMQGLELAAAARDVSLEDFIPRIERIVHGTTVTTNALLTRRGAKVGLLTTRGMRDALEMRRGIREEQYNNRQTNVEPLVPRYLRAGVGGRIDRTGRETEPLDAGAVREALELFAREQVEAIAVCFMNAWANDDHEQHARRLIAEHLPGCYVSVSTEVMPAIRFYNRLSTTVLSAYVGPILDRYLDRLVGRLGGLGFEGTLLIMQSSGGVVSPEVARRRAALTLLSGPAAGPAAGLATVAPHDRADAITCDMGGTSFDAALVTDGAAALRTEADVDRLRIALPTLDIVTIGAGGGSIARIDEGGLLRMGPESAGARPGPVCYGIGGTEPTCTDADLILGLLDPDYFAGGTMRLDLEAARRVVEDRIGKPLGLGVEQAAAGMYRVINTNMALGVRQVSVQRGVDPRDLPLVVAGGAGPLHACAIMRELGIPMAIVPRNAPTFCASGMLLTDLEHGFVASCPMRLASADWPRLHELVDEMSARGRERLARDGIAPDRMEIVVTFEMRYLRQYHEVSVEVPRERMNEEGVESITETFHARHALLCGYDLKSDGTGTELINLRVRAIGRLDRVRLPASGSGTAGSEPPLKGERPVFLPGEGAFRELRVLDFDRLQPGQRCAGPALVEGRQTTVWIAPDFDAFVDSASSLVVHAKDHHDPRMKVPQGEAR